MDIENIVFEIIVNSGQAKSIAYEALSLANKGEIELAKKTLIDSNEFLLNSHKIQTEMIQNEVLGKKNEVTILLVHAQDHLNAATEICTLVEYLIEMNEKIKKLEDK